MSSPHGFPRPPVTGSNLPWRIERNGINTVPEPDRAGRARDLFWVWFAANISILAVVYGAIVLSFGLDLVQSALVIVLGSVTSFLLVGAFSVAGRDGGVPTMTLSRGVFGMYGNLLPSAVGWVSLVGWETVTVITGTLAAMSLLSKVVHMGTVGLGLSSMAVIAGLVIAFGLLGQATLVVVQRWASWLLGALTIVIMVQLLPGTPWHRLLSRPAGPWMSGVLPAFSIVVAGAGLGWANAAADYSRYLPRALPGRRILWSTALGACVPLVTLMAVGLLLAARDPSLSTASNPLAVIEKALPSWMAVPFLLSAIGGQVTQANLGLYSSGLTLLNMFVPLARYKTVMIDAVIMIAGTVLVVLVWRSFFAPFESFLLVLGVGLAAWSGVFLTGVLWGRARSAITGGSAVLHEASATSFLVTRDVGAAALVGFCVGVLSGLALTTSPIFDGPLASGVFAGSDLGLLVAFVSGGTSFWLLGALQAMRSQTPAGDGHLNDDVPHGDGQHPISIPQWRSRA